VCSRSDSSPGCYATVATSDPLDALSKSRDFKDEIHLLLTDVTMPQMDGLTLTEYVLAERGKVRVLLMSGCSSVSSRLPLLKPFGKSQLLEQVARVIGGPPPRLSDVFACGKHAPDDARAALLAALANAGRRYLEETRKFLDITKGVPSGIPEPDGTLILRLQATRTSQAFEEYQKAWKELGDHIAGRSAPNPPKCEK